MGQRVNAVDGGRGMIACDLQQPREGFSTISGVVHN
jgi:hypothetical protein